MKSPHVYIFSENCFNDMVNFRSAQSIIITGESGSGKTESAKFVMKQLAKRSAERKTDEAGLEDKFLASNPVLEAFGNSKTCRNNNSSRFGKLIEI